MRHILMASAAASLMAATPLSAAELLPARLSIYLDPVFDQDGAVASFSDFRSYDMQIVDNAFSGRFGDVLGATIANPDGELAFDIEMSGEVFPFLSLSGSLIDNGVPSTFSIQATLMIPAISEPATYDLSGTINTVATITTHPSLSRFFGYQINGTPLASLGDGPLTGNLSASDQGSLDCGFLPGGCVQMSSFFGATGPGNGQAFSFTTIFDLNADTTPVPVPASLLLLLSGVAGIAAFARRRLPA